jgi:hypothetical protein
MLWLIDPEEPHNAYPADMLTSLIATAVAAGLMDPPDLPVRGVADLAKVRQENVYD